MNDASVAIQEMEEMLGQDGTKELFEAFLDDAHPISDDLDSAFDSADQEPLRRSAHKLKGCCASIMARETERLAKALEHAAADGNWDEVNKLFPSVKSSLMKTIKCVSDYVQ